MRTKNALTSFWTPLRWIMPYAIGAILLLEIVRFYIDITAPSLLGWNINMVILFITLGLFIYGSARQRHVITAGVSPRTHTTGGLLFSLIWCVLLAIANTASSCIAQLNDDSYSNTDPFFVPAIVTAEVSDSDAPVYMVSSIDITIEGVAISFAIHVACLAGIAGIGLLLGAISTRWNPLTSIGFTVVAVFIAVMVCIVMAQHDVRVQAPIPGVFTFMVPLAVLGHLLGFLVSATCTRKILDEPSLEEADLRVGV